MSETAYQINMSNLCIDILKHTNFEVTKVVIVLTPEAGHKCFLIKCSQITRSPSIFLRKI